jgi:AsmA protein
VDGALEGMDLTYELRRAQALFRRQALPERTAGTPVRTRFETLTASSRLAEGVLTSDPIRMVTDVLQVSGKGTFRLKDQAVDYRLTAVVQEVPPTGADASLAELRSLQIPLSITGTVQDYKVRPDVSDLAKARVKQEVQKRGEELKKKATDKLRERLKGLFGGGEDPPPEQPQ